MHILNLDKNFENKAGPIIDNEIFHFPAGESHIKIKQEIDLISEITIWHRLNNGNNIMELLLATDACRRKFKNAKINAYFPYCPYGRQDRKMIGGEPFSLKVFADLINSQNYNRVISLEPHSDVTAALINNFEEDFPYYLLRARDAIHKEYGCFYLIAPDAGALKRIYKQAQFMNYKGNILCASKVRDVSSGKIIRTKVEASDQDIQDKVILILDDIVSRGGTFMALSKELKNMGAKHVILVAAHYEDVADEDALKESGIEKVYTTNSISNQESKLVTKFRIDP